MFINKMTFSSSILHRTTAVIGLKKTIFNPLYSIPYIDSFRNEPHCTVQWCLSVLNTGLSQLYSISYCTLVLLEMSLTAHYSIPYRGSYPLEKISLTAHYSIPYRGSYPLEKN
jgi:hypothetical protein